MSRGLHSSGPAIWTFNGALRPARTLGRVLRNLVFAFIFLIGFIVLRVFRPSSGPELLRILLEKGGGGFIKLGQLLAMRWDLLPPEYCQALAKLLDRVQPLPVAIIRQEIERQFGRPLAECYTDFEDLPLGSASLAQVHGARLLSGEPVAVKVLRPGIEYKIGADLLTMKMGASLLDGTLVGESVRCRPIVDELERLTLEEIDMRREARNADALQRLMEADDLDHRAPRVYFAFVSERVLTMERFYGISATELIEAVNLGNTEKLEDLARRGILPQRTARLLFRSIMRQVYEFRLFHADPHASNIILLDSGTLAFVDFGMVGWLDEQLWAQQFRLFDFISRNRIHQAYLTMVESFSPLSQQNLTEFESDFKSLLHDWMLAAESPYAGVAEKSTGRFLFRAILAIRRAGLALPTSVMRVHRTTIISDMIELQLFPQLNILGEMREFYLEAACRRACNECTLEKVQEIAKDSINIVLKGPSFALTVMEWMETRLPEIAQSFEYQITKAEEVLAVALMYMRLVTLISIPIVFVLWIWGAMASPGAPAPPYDWLWSIAVRLNGSLVLMWVLAAGFTAHVLGRMLKRLGAS